MRGDIPEAAFRLMVSLPSRTHERPEPSYKISAASEARKRKIRVHGVVYESIIAAATALDMDRNVLTAWARTGKAEYV